MPRRGQTTHAGTILVLLGNAIRCRPIGRHGTARRRQFEPWHWAEDNMSPGNEADATSHLLAPCEAPGTAACRHARVTLHVLSADPAMPDRVEQLLETGSTISVHVMNEFAAVALRKRQMFALEVREVLDAIRAVRVVEPVTAEMHERGLLIHERTDSRSTNRC